MKKTSLSLLLFSVFIAGCASTHKVPVTKRDQMITLSKEDEISIAKNEYKRIINKATMCTDKTKIETVKRVGQRITKNMKHFNQYKWEFILIENDSINACCLPDGRVLINSGVFKVAKTDDQLATIISHEIAHAISRHGAARISRAKALNMGEGLGAVFTAIVNPFLLVPFVVAYESTSKHAVEKFSIIEENEADIIGIHLMKKANYNLNEALVFWNNMKNLNSSKVNGSASHTTYDKRKLNIMKTIKQLEDNKLKS